MDSLELLIGAVATLIGVIAATGGYLLKRLQKLDRESEARQKVETQALREANTRLERELADVTERVKEIPALRKQIEQAEEQGRKTVELLASVNERLTKAEQALETANDKLKTEQQKNARLETENADLKRDNERLTQVVTSYETAFRLIGLQIKTGPGEASKESAEPAPVVSESAPGGEVVTEVKSDGK